MPMGHHKEILLCGYEWPGMGSRYTCATLMLLTDFLPANGADLLRAVNPRHHSAEVRTQSYFVLFS